MTGEGGTQAELDARMLAELRAWRQSPSVKAKLEAGKDAYLSLDEIDMLLRIADERDALRREACAERDEKPPRVEIPAGHALVDGVLVELPADCRGCGHVLHTLNGGECWVVVGEANDGAIFCHCRVGA